MSKTKERVSYDASVCAIVDLCGITTGELIVLTFENETEWTGDYDLTIYNSPKKNTKNTIDGAITLDGVFMDVLLNPDDQDIIEGDIYYYEIFDNTSERVIIKGNLNIQQ